jgi:hypothetical protein
LYADVGGGNYVLIELNGGHDFGGCDRLNPHRGGLVS